MVSHLKIGPHGRILILANLLLVVKVMQLDICLILDPIDRFLSVILIFHSKLNLQKDPNSELPGILTGSQKSGSRLHKNRIFSRGSGFFSE